MRVRSIFAFLLCVLVFCGCSDSNEGGDGKNIKNYIAPETSPYHYPEGHSMEGLLVRGATKDNVVKYSFDFIYKPLADRPVRVHFYLPNTADVTRCPVLFGFHGAERVATNMTTPWSSYADNYGFVVIAPEFPNSETKSKWGYDLGFGASHYQYGNIMNSSVCNSEELWSYNIIEALFDHFKECVGGKQKNYRMYGMSAGGQFVCRYVMAMPHARLERACAASPSSWAYPYPEGLTNDAGNVYGWPYSAKNTSFANDDAMRVFLQKKLLLMCGVNDSDENSSSLDKNAGAMAQGKHRYERMLNFYDACQKRATQLGITCAFEMRAVEGVAHSNKGIINGDGKGNDAHSWLFSDLIK